MSTDFAVSKQKSRRSLQRVMETASVIEKPAKSSIVQQIKQQKIKQQNIVYRIVLGSPSRVLSKGMIMNKASQEGVTDGVLIDKTLKELCDKRIIVQQDTSSLYCVGVQRFTAPTARRRKVLTR